SDQESGDKLTRHFLGMASACSSERKYRKLVAYLFVVLKFIWEHPHTHGCHCVSLRLKSQFMVRLPTPQSFL
ncbi:hypothetical protein HispidOSU_001135, partial [Sigmodon hispidus]